MFSTWWVLFSCAWVFRLQRCLNSLRCSRISCLACTFALLRLLFFLWQTEHQWWQNPQDPQLLKGKSQLCGVQKLWQTKYKQLHLNSILVLIDVTFLRSCCSFLHFAAGNRYLPNSTRLSFGTFTAIPVPSFTEKFVPERKVLSTPTQNL